MIKIFRKIRQRLLTENKITRYLIYVLGEVLLVVIGILIALQINNWNEWRKDRIKEKEILIELAVTITNNIERIDKHNQDATRNNDSRDIIISLFIEKPPFSDSLKRHFFVSSLGYEISTLNYGGYEMLKNEGFNILKSAMIRKEIVNLFEISFMNLSKEEMEKRSEVYVADVARYLIKNFTDRGKPNDYFALLNDQSYVENLKAMKMHESWLMEVRIETLEESKRVLQLIKDELNE